MKILIYVDYSNPEFNKDFKLSNELLSAGHNVFLAVNNEQFDALKGNCDRVLVGYSSNESLIGAIKLTSNFNINDL